MEGPGAPKTRIVAFRVTPKYWEMLQLAALDRGIKVQELLEEAVALYLGKRSAFSARQREGMNNGNRRLNGMPTLQVGKPTRCDWL